MTEIARVLEERARRFARPVVTSPRGETTDLLVIAVRGERYAVELEFVVEAAVLRGFIPLPGLPPFVAGVVLNRGRLLALFDLGVLLHLPAESGAGKAHLVVIETERFSFGILADEIHGVVSVMQSEITERKAETLVRAVSPVGAILDVDALAADPRIRIEQELP